VCCVFISRPLSSFQKLNKYEMADPTGSRVKVQYVILDLSPNGHIDSTSVRSLEELLSDYKARGVKLCLCNPSKMVMELLVKSSFVEKVGYDNIFISEHQAVSVCVARLAETEVSDGPETYVSNGPEA
jgi:MFS superfamily sulfate permease-like transporter